MENGEKKADDSKTTGICDELDPKYQEIKESGAFGALFEMFSSHEVTQIDKAGSEFSAALEKFKYLLIEALQDPEKRKELQRQMETGVKPPHRSVKVDVQDG